MKKKLLGILLGIGVMLTASGCGAELKNFIGADLPDALAGRVESNRRIAEALLGADFISQDTYDNIEKNLYKQLDEYTKLAQGVPADGKTPLLKSIVTFCCVNGTALSDYGHQEITLDDGSVVDVSSLYCTGEDTDPLIQLFMINYLKHYSGASGNKIYNSNHWAYPNYGKFSDSGNSIDPIVLVSSSIMKEINEKFDYEVYVLSPDIATKDGTGSIDGVMSLIQSSVKLGDNGASITNISTLNNYFVKAVDEKGEPVKLLEDDNGEIPIEYQIIQPSKYQHPKDNHTEPGYDLIIRHWDVPTFTLRLNEFNQEAFNNLNDLIGLNSNKYVFYQKGDVKRVYLMEYPVSYLESIEQDSTVENKVYGNIEQSGIGLNMLTGDIIKYNPDGSGGFLASGTVINESVDKYLTVQGADNENQQGLSSFIIKGMTTTPISYSLKTGDVNKTVACGRIILRDYLEASFAPDFVPGENVAVFGRKLRLDFSNWEEEDFVFNGTTISSRKQYRPYWFKNSKAAYYIDKDGQRISTNQELLMTDFCDAQELLKDSLSDCKVVSIVEGGQTPGSVDAKDVTGTPQINELARKTVGSGTKVKLTHYFPSADIGADDFDTDTEMKQRFYCIATKKNLFESGLYAEWINSTSTTASLTWWNQYLADNGFIYTVGKEALQEYLASEYAYELSQNGAIILDLDVVSDIQDMYDHDNIINRTSLIRTFFMFLGWVLIVYATILMLCWALDANADIGIKLLNKATMGHWVAVKYEDDIPYQNTNDLTYITFGKLITKCLIIMGTGLLLIYVNVFTVVLYLIDLLGSFASEVEKIIQGIR